MNLAVLLAKDTPNLEQMPGEWPVECRELGDSTILPNDGKAWILMTYEELKAWQLTYIDAKNIWNAANPVSNDE